ncbi:glycohydrolase toxin TNT-related protein [Streptomyces griseoaurantiacus]
MPWFGQPGGGTAYVLPKAVDELLAEGVLTEIDAATTPPPRPRPTAPH